MSTSEEQVALLTDKLNMLEIESRRLLTALNWASKVRLILIGCLLLFMAVSVFMFYRLYVDIRTNRIAEVQRIINEDPEEFAEPLTKQVMLLAEEQGPYVIEKFREQAQQDSELFLDAFDAERTTLISNLQNNLETKLRDSYAAMLAEQEEMLRAEFPVLEDPEKLQNIRANMEKIYDKIGKRYLVDSLREEMESIANKIDTFPPSELKQDNIPLGEQIATELLELVRMMLVNAENYQIPAGAQAVSATGSSQGKGNGPAPVDVSLEGKAPEETADKDGDDAKSDEDESSTPEDKPGGDSKTADDKPADDKSADDKSADDKSADDKPADDKSADKDNLSDEDKTAEEDKSNSTDEDN